MRYVRSGDVNGSILMEALAMAGPFEVAGSVPLVPAEDFQYATNYQGCLEIWPRGGRPGARYRVPLPPRDVIPQKLCIGRERGMSPYETYDEHLKPYYLGPVVPPRNLPAMSKAEKKAVEEYQSGLGWYDSRLKENPEVASDLHDWGEMAAEFDCWDRYHSQRESIKSQTKQLRLDKEKLILDLATTRAKIQSEVLRHDLLEEKETLEQDLQFAISELQIETNNLEGQVQTLLLQADLRKPRRQQAPMAASPMAGGTK